MKRKIKYGLAGLALGLSCLFGAPAFAADYTGDCAGLAGNFDGNGNVDITDGSCTITSLSATGHINITASGAVSIGTLSAGTSSSITGLSINATGGISTNGGSLALVSTNGLITTTALTSAFGGITITSAGSTGSITSTTITANGGPLNVNSSNKVTFTGQIQTDFDYIDIRAAQDIAVTKVYSGWKLKIVSTNGKIVANAGSATVDALKAVNYGPMEVTAKKTLAITGVASSINADITLMADGNITARKISSGNSLSITSNTGLVTVNGGSKTNVALKADNFGNVQVKAKTALTITGTTTATKYNVELQADNDVKANAVNAGASMKIVSITGKIDITADDLKANTFDGGGNMLLVANKTIATKSLFTKGSAKTGGIEIQANKGTAPVPFIIGGTGNANGVNGNIDTTSANGGGTDPNFITGGIFITNGQSGSTGDITITSATNIKVKSTASRSGLIYLNAQDGTLSIPGGNALNTDAGTGGAGEIQLVAKTITVGADSTISASQTTGTTNHGIMIAAETINYSGSSGLALSANGNGVSGSSLAHIAIYPKGSLTITSSSNSSGTDYPYQYLFWSTSVTPKDAPLNIVGGSNSPIKVSANGTDTRIDIRGNGTTFTGAAVTIEAKGKGVNHVVNITDTGSADNKGLTFGGLGAVLVDASGDNAGGTGAAGGDISITSDILTFNGSNHSLKATGPDTGNGDGGSIYLATSQSLVLNSASKMTLNADAASTGNGNAIVGDPAVYGRKAIQFYPGQITADFGNAANQYSLSAKGGGTGGNGGTIMISMASSHLKSMTPSTASAIDASAQSNNGDGGEVFFYNYISLIDDDATVNVIGKGTGKGGKFTAFYYEVPNSFEFRTPSTMFKVNGGDGLNVSGFDGSITLANIPCRQWKIGTGTGNASWPKTYWKCANPDTVTSDVYTAPADFANGLNVTLKGQLGANNNELYVFLNQANFTAYLNLPITGSTVPAATRFYPNEADIIPENVLTSIFKPTPTKEQLNELAAHEFGHNLDKNASEQSLNGNYTISRYRDFATLDYVVMGSSENDPANVPRDACVGATAPFKDAIDESDGTQICQSGVLASKFKPGGIPMKNRKIAEIASPRLNPRDSKEFYAQSFAISVYAKNLTVAQMLSTTADVVIGKNGYFACTTAWANNRATGSIADPSGLSTGCTTQVPVWYEDLLLTP